MISFKEKKTILSAGEFQSRELTRTYPAVLDGLFVRSSIGFVKNWGSSSARAGKPK
jgi:hypothetical protein